jgi:aminoglycoside phosphotransferase (APT) family kinase protein
VTFKANWEKTSTRLNLSEDLILKMLGTYYTGNNDIKSVSIIPGGCANINVLVQLNTSDTTVILRVYLRDKESVYREQKISSLLHKKLPVPEFYHIGEYNGYTFAIIEYLPGQTLRDLLLKGKAPDISPYAPAELRCDKSDIMFKVGRTLGEIAKIKFPSSGFFNKNLEVEKDITSEGFVNFCFECLENNKVKATVPQEQREQIKNIFRVYKNLLPDEAASNLVHADFDPANILVTEVNGKIEVSGILDWEFSFAGSSLCDVANMLRYAHQIPNNYQESFLKGLRGSGYELPSSWQITVNLLNIVSLLDCLVRSDSKNRPNQIKDIQELINNILESKCWRKVLKPKQEW